MSDAGWFAVAVVLLIACLAAGFRYWGSRDLGPAGAGWAAKFVLISTTIGGLLGAPFWWLDLPPSFAWDLPPVASRMLAAAAFAFGVTGLMMLQRPSMARTRLYLILIVTYLVPLALVAVLFHLDRFDFTQPVTYGFFSVVVVLSFGSLLALTRPAGMATSGNPPSATVAIWLYVGGVLLGLWGIALFLVPTTAFPLVFNWAKDALSSRLIAAMLFTIATAFLLSRHDLGRARLALVFAGTYGVGVVAACLMNVAAGLPVPPLYAGGFALVAVVSLFLLAAAEARAGRRA